MDAEVIFTAAVFAGVLISAFGLSYWAFRARTDRSAYVGLLLVIGFPALLLVIAGLAFLLTSPDFGVTLLAIGLALGLPLLKPVRVVVARVTPLDPNSPVDMTGLSMVLTVTAISVLALGADPEGTITVGIADLIFTVIAYVGLAYAAVGLGFHRTFRQATQRLGIHLPTLKTILIAIGFVFLGFLVSASASLLTQIFQPDLAEEIQSVTEDMTADVQDPLGAVILGLSSGIGEEVLLRGAVQPRFGLVPTSILFAVLHTQYGASFILLGLFGIGLLLGIERKYFGTTAAIITHAIFNAVVVLAQVYGG